MGGAFLLQYYIPRSAPPQKGGKAIPARGSRRWLDPLDPPGWPISGGATLSPSRRGTVRPLLFEPGTP